ncbi:capsule biosynthesis protein [Neisseria sp. ZJ106]|uniref:Capsule biosynthesis protein n=1 Tax=Neisseria lisongii TaxID=2912188 RepID=A0ABY7RJN0_9NEIS|nr:capsule biosynthesis protein [Neisseria lisongii]MCF7520565.1 capsule biosynthesis protein [Neisseria lisongii]WCL71498.1 capsule biosynthesis protein [Neisseria lisongii]
MTHPIRSHLHQLIDSADNILLLQGPVGSFFRHFSAWLHNRHGKTVHKFNFNAGDEYFYPERTAHTLAYTAGLDEFAEFLGSYLSRHHIQAVACFGDTRPYHRIARQVCESQGVGFWAFEEGYFRPFFVTLEKTGVNAYSPLPREAGFFLEQYPKLAEQTYHAPPTVPGGFTPMAKNAALYYLKNRSGRKKYPNYVHHRSASLCHYLHLWTLSAFKRLSYRLEDFTLGKQVEAGVFGKFFIVPLQVFNDSQVRIHCDFDSVRSFLLHVLASFAEHAPADTHLIVKHHPMDRGFIDYAEDIKRFIKQHPQLSGRVTYVHDVPLPVFLAHGIGMVTINSTSGLSAMIHGMPVKVLGRAHYDIPGMTDQSDLAGFWRNPTPPDKELFHAYRMYHINTTQINGSFYSRVNFPEIERRPSEKQV